MSSIWTPRKYHELALAFGMRLDRFNLHMSPGMGKTSTALTLLVAKNMMADALPALVIGPKRVVNSVWTREVEKWSHLQGLRVSKIIGNESARKEALKPGADIYCINYENLVWLHLQLEHTRWPFKAILPDESTRTKGHRCSWQTHKVSGKVFMRAAGAVNAAALMRNAPKSPIYVNMTGTPAPNGLKDLWGPQFPIDHGASLGQSFEAFSRRWFRTVPGSTREQQRIEPLAHAEKEILARIKPTTISLNAYDWFDVERPREVDIDVELPEAAMKQYRKLHQESVLRLSEETIITAVNGGALTNKCLQFASGHIFDEDKLAHQVHTEKLDALESLMENLNGAPLLVAYQYIPDREAILRRFKGAELLPSDERQKDVEDRWNAGKIPMLVVHPKSAGHGLDLQYGGHNLCLYTPTWDLELYEQVIERIGPVRQAQAGLDRLVNVYRLRTVGTWDGAVLGRTKDKASVQDSVRAVLRADGLDLAPAPDINDWA